MHNEGTAQSLISSLRYLLKRELLIAFRNRQSLTNPLIFFAIVIVLFPLGISPEPSFLKTASIGLVWVAALLSMMLSLEGLFLSDYDDGSLEQLVLCSHPLYLLVVVKSFVYWCLTAVPLIIISPLFALMLHIELSIMPLLLATLLIGTPVITLIGSIGAALTVSLRGGGVLVSLLVLPLTIPVLIFGSGTVQAGIDGLPTSGYLAIMLMMLVLALTLAPFATAAALKMSVSN